MKIQKVFEPKAIQNWLRDNSNAVNHALVEAAFVAGQDQFRDPVYVKHVKDGESVLQPMERGEVSRILDDLERV